MPDTHDLKTWPEPFEADAMRELAWRWCIEAAEQRRARLLAECERAFERVTVAELRLELHRLRGTP